MSVEKASKDSAATILCAKCGNQNPPRTNLCNRCGARLYIVCRKCGHSNRRSASHCTDCDHRLHRSSLSWSRIRKRLFGSKSKITPVQIVLLVVFVLCAYKTIVYLAEYKAPTYEGE